jgi:hypothetical protein
MPPIADAVGQRFVGMTSGLIVVGYWDISPGPLHRYKLNSLCRHLI